MGLKIISPPITITDSILVSSTVPEPDTGEVAWNISTGYSLGDVVYRNHKLYESIHNGTNTGHNPDLEVQNDPNNPPANWLYLNQYTNRWRALDNIRSSQTIGNSPMTYVFQFTTAIQAIALFNVFADSVTITARLGTEVVYTYTESLFERNPTTFLEWGTLTFDYKDTVAVYDIPPFIGLEVTITFTSNTGTCKWGGFVAGQYVDIGDIQYGAKIKAYNYSTIQEQFDGTLLLTPRIAVPEPDLQVMVEKTKVDTLYRLRDELNAKPTAYIGLDQVDDPYYRSVLVLGVYTQFEVDLAYFSHAMLNLRVREMS